MLIATEVWVGALIRRVNLAGAVATVLRKGDAGAGAVIVRTRDPKSGAEDLFAQRAGETWIRPLATADPAELDAWLERAVARDPDLWVMEIDAPEAQRFLTEAVEE